MNQYPTHDIATDEEDNTPRPPHCLPKRSGEERVSDGCVWKGVNGDWVNIGSLSPKAKN